VVDRTRVMIRSNHARYYSEMPAVCKPGYLTYSIQISDVQRASEKTTRLCPKLQGTAISPRIPISHYHMLDLAITNDFRSQ
jgi:hypothetical protein